MKINQENLALLRAAIVEAENQDTFDINLFRHECGLPSCIIGWVSHLRDPKDRLNHYAAKKENADWLGVNVDELEEIYIGWAGWLWLHPTTGERTISTPPLSAVLTFLDIMRDQDRVPYWWDVR